MGRDVLQLLGAEYMSANHPSRSAVDAVPHESRSSICMNSSIISAFAATLIVFSVSKAIAMDDVSSVLVNPTEEKKISDEDRWNRTKPYVSIYAVNPPINACLSERCWPSVSFFVANPDKQNGQDITVECDAFSKNGTLLSKGFETPRMEAEEADISGVLFETSRFDEFARVDCKVVQATRNLLRKR